MPGPDPRKTKFQEERKGRGPKMGRSGLKENEKTIKKDGKLIIMVVGEDGKSQYPELKARGGRAGYKNAGSVKGCKMAKAGKGRAYGKNS